MLLLLFLTLATTYAHGQCTRLGFYSPSCPRVEYSIVRSTVQSHFRSDPEIAPGFLRMNFHDCLVHGCDGSILIDGENTEKTAGANLDLSGYNVIDDAKTQLEEACPAGVVSCADILALAARYSLVLGGHTTGTSACQFFRYRLYNFTTTANGVDPSSIPAFLPQVQALCPANSDGSQRVALDTGSGGSFDVFYFINFRNGRGVLESDQKLWTDASTRTNAQRYSGRIEGLQSLRFNVEFGRAMVKMGNIGVKTGGSGGEIPRSCSAFN